MLAGAGARLALGSDSQAVIDLLEEARAVELDERLASTERGRHGTAQLLGAATAGGYTSLGLGGDGGRIAAGALADLTTIALDSVRLAGTPPLDGAVFCAGAADRSDVVLDRQIAVVIVVDEIIVAVVRGSALVSRVKLVVVVERGLVRRGVGSPAADGRIVRFGLLGFIDELVVGHRLVVAHDQISLKSSTMTPGQPVDWPG